jgi:hypothetical protein
VKGWLLLIMMAASFARLQEPLRSSSSASDAVLASSNRSGMPKLAERPVWRPPKDMGGESPLWEDSRSDDWSPEARQPVQGGPPERPQEGSVPADTGAPKRAGRGDAPSRTGRSLPKAKKQAGKAPDSQKKVSLESPVGCHQSLPTNGSASHEES